MQTRASYDNALAFGTRLNRKNYIKFSLIYGFHHLQPSVTNVCMYAQHLANTHAAPTSIKNSISGAKTWVAEHRGCPDAFLSPQLGHMIKGFVKRSSHVPRRAAPLAPHHIRIICDMLDASPSASSGIKPAILIGYACFLRSSNILSPSIQVWGGPHTLLAYHIKTDDQGLRIYINSTKTCPSGTGPIFVIPYSSPRRYCPVSAWIAYKETVNPWPLGPAFVHRSGIPITPREVVGCMRIALQQQPDILPSQVTMHSLRRGATYAAVDQGLPIDTIKARGTWKSDSGVAPYLPVSKKVQTLRVHNMAN